MKIVYEWLNKENKNNHFTKTQDLYLKYKNDKNFKLINIHIKIMEKWFTIRKNYD